MHWRHLGVIGTHVTATRFFILSSLYMCHALALPSETALCQRELEAVGKCTRQWKTPWFHSKFLVPPPLTKIHTFQLTHTSESNGFPFRLYKNHKEVVCPVELLTCSEASISHPRALSAPSSPASTKVSLSWRMSLSKVMKRELFRCYRSQPGV